MGWRAAVIGLALIGAAWPYEAAAEQGPAPAPFVEPIPLPGPSGSPNTYQPPPLPASPPSAPAPGATQPPRPPSSTPIALPASGTRFIQIMPRSSTGYNVKYIEASPNDPDGQSLAILTNGVTVLATFVQFDPILKADKTTILDIQTDELVIWSRGGQARDIVESQAPQATEGKRKIEFYMQGNVILRYGNSTEKKNPDGTPMDDRTVRAERIYYDVTKNKAIALNGELQMMRPGIRDPAIVKSREIWQLSPNEFRAFDARLSSSGLPSDPGFSIGMRQTDIETEKQPRRTIFGETFYNRTLKEDQTIAETMFTGEELTFRLLDTPVFYLPYLSGNVNDPLGPLQGVTIRSDKLFGQQILTTFSVLELIGLTPMLNERWDLNLDYLSRRGPGIGTTYTNRDDKLFGYEMPFNTEFKSYFIYDQADDILGGPREADYVPSKLRGRSSWRGQVELTPEWTFQGQLAYLSDRNFYEQYYKTDFDQGPNMETFAHFKYQDGTAAATLLAQSNLHRDWVTQTNWLPKVDGYLLGQSFFDRFTYNAWGSAAYADLQTAKLTINRSTTPALLAVAPAPYERSDVSGASGRIDVMQELSMPFQAGPVKVVPYAKLDLADYSNDISGQNLGRVYGAGGVRANMPLSRLDTDVQSELFNVNGLYHKIDFGANYYYAYSNVHAAELRQFDRLNDDATDQALRDIHPFQEAYVPGGKGVALYSSPLFDPQAYAIRRLLDSNPDTLDSVQVLQLSIDQRWQTKRGYPGMEHTVDWLTLDLSASIFPEKDRDNFGKAFSFLEYNANWYMGDRTGVTSSGWFDPSDPSINYWSIGGFLNRPDRTNYSVSYRQFDLVNSKALTASVNYVFSAKYAITASTTYDFGLNKSLSNSLLFSRTGTDLTINFGLSYNAILNNFGVQFEVVPNLLASRTAGRGLFAPTSVVGK